MTAAEIVEELASLGSESVRKVLRKHGARDPLLGVKIGDMKPIVRRVKQNYKLALELYDTGIYDAMYLAGLIADDARMTRKDLSAWVKKAEGGALATATVPWVAAGSPHGAELAREWIDSKDETTAVCGWSTLSALVSLKPDRELDLALYTRLLKRVQDSIHKQPDAVRAAMNHFIICAGCYVCALTDLALETAARIGKVTADRGDTECKVPDAAESIKKVEARGSLGKKKKTVKC